MRRYACSLRNYLVSKQWRHGKGRRLKPPDQVSRFVVSQPSACGACGTLLMGEDPEPSRHQVTELPRIEPEVVEYQVHCLRCLACGQETRGEWPSTMPTGCFGPRLQAVGPPPACVEHTFSVRGVWALE